MRRHGWKAAVALVLAVTAWALAGAAWNRSGPQAELVLTERELPVASAGLGGRDESSGVSLLLGTTWLPGASGYGLDPELVDARQLATLGFDVELPSDAVAAWTKVRRQRSRPGFAALEYDGPAFAARAERARAWAATREDRQRLEIEKAIGDVSRLVVVEVGPDAAALRARHPDRRRVLVLPAQVSIWLAGGNERVCAPPACRVAGGVKLLVDELNVPHALAAALPTDARRRWTGAPALTAAGQASAGPPRYEVVVREGRRHEPWIAAVRPLATP